MTPVRGVCGPGMLRLPIAEHIDGIDRALGVGKLRHNFGPGKCSRQNIVEQNDGPIRSVFGSLDNVTKVIVNYMCHTPLRAAGHCCLRCIICHK